MADSASARVDPEGAVSEAPKAAEGASAPDAAQVGAPAPGMVMQKVVMVDPAGFAVPPVPQIPAGFERPAQLPAHPAGQASSEIIGSIRTSVHVG